MGKSMTNRISTVILGAALSIAASDAFAITNYNISGMTCAKVQALVQTDGAAILSYPSDSILGLPIYDRYVRSRQDCASDEVIRRTGVPTADKKYCPVSKCVHSDIFVSR